jgi:hypothetical protein
MRRRDQIFHQVRDDDGAPEQGVQGVVRFVEARHDRSVAGLSCGIDGVMKCVKCGLRKGKRACPALKGDICAQCCGTHRLKEISCPADCSWLGGLAVLAGGDDASAIDAVAVLRAARPMLEKVAQWSPPSAVKKTMATNALTFIGEEELDERDDWHEDLLGASVFMSAIDGGKKPVEVFLETHARDLATNEVHALRALASAKLAVHRVREVAYEAGFKRVAVTDIVSNEESEVIVSAMSNLDDGDLSVGFLASIGGKPHLLFEVPVLEEMDELVVEEWQRSPGAVTFLKFIRDEGHAHWDDDGDGDTDTSALEQELREEDEALEKTFAILQRDRDAWMNAPNALLDGKTPRAAATNPETVPGPIDMLVDNLELWAEEMETDYPWEELRAALDIPRRHIEGYAPTYDPRVEPDERWFKVHEDTQIDSVEAHHEALGDKHPPVDEGSHDVVHAMIERFVKANHYGAKDALDRLRAAGLTRHEAVHALVDVFSKKFFDSVEDDNDPTTWVTTLPKAFADVDATPYKGTAP